MRNERERLSGDGEISLFEIIHGIWRYKAWGMLVALPVFAGGLAYALLAKPVYEAQLFVQPPSMSEISQLNYGRGGDTGLAVVAVKDVYEAYLRSLQSAAVRNNFFRNVYLPSLSESERAQSRDVLYSEFGKILKVSLAAKDAPDRYVIAASVENPADAVKWVTEYADIAADRAKREILKSYKSELSLKADNLRQQIDGAKASAREERDDKIARLTESSAVAKSIGLVKPPLISGSLSSEMWAAIEGSLSYMRGSEALEAEIAILKSRTSDDPFIVDLRKEQEKLDFYRNLKIDPSVISVYQQDGGVELPDSPVKPKRLLILFFAALFALVLGSFSAALRAQWARLRNDRR